VLKRFAIHDPAMIFDNRSIANAESNFRINASREWRGLVASYSICQNSFPFTADTGVKKWVILMPRLRQKDPVLPARDTSSGNYFWQSLYVRERSSEAIYASLRFCRMRGIRMTHFFTLILACESELILEDAITGGAVSSP
jgi:hypothetical protein